MPSSKKEPARSLTRTAPHNGRGTPAQLVWNTPLSLTSSTRFVRYSFVGYVLHIGGDIWLGVQLGMRMTSPSKMNVPRSCSTVIIFVTSAVSKSSCLSGGIAALRYVTSAAIVSSSDRAYVILNRCRIEREAKSSLSTRARCQSLPPRASRLLYADRETCDYSPPRGGIEVGEPRRKDHVNVHVIPHRVIVLAGSDGTTAIGPRGLFELP